MNNKFFVSTAILLLSLVAVSCSDAADKDLTAPVITDEGIVAAPIDCNSYQRGDTIAMCYRFMDNKSFGNYNIEIHSNFDHHTHGTSATECEHHEHAEEIASTFPAWIYNHDFTIPAGSKDYTAVHQIAIPDTIAPGDYHFAIRLTDQAGWQQIKAVAIEIEE